MEFRGEERIEASRETVWAFLSDPHQVTQCAPGIQSVSVVDETRFTCQVKAGVGMIRATFDFNCEWVERDEPNRARIIARGNASGSAVEMDSTMLLSDIDAGGTLMEWSANAKISGKLAGIGSRMIQPVADRMTKQIFDCIRGKLENA
jgi:hypothetical protein